MIQDSKLEKKCTKCKRIYPATTKYFFRRSNSKDGLNGWCKECNKQACRKYNKTEKGKLIRQKYQQSKKGKNCQKRYAATIKGKNNRKNNSLKSKYNFTLKEYNTLFKKQNGKCAICSKPETTSNQHGVRVLSVDHDHKTNKVRALLCDRCNRMIGFAKENKKILYMAIKYLEKHV